MAYDFRREKITYIVIQRMSPKKNLRTHTNAVWAQTMFLKDAALKEKNCFIHDHHSNRT